MNYEPTPQDIADTIEEFAKRDLEKVMADGEQDE